MRIVKVVRVTFNDSATFNRWTMLEDMVATGTKPCAATGMLIREDKDVVSIGLLDDGGAAVSDWINIPRNAITKIITVGKVAWPDGN